ncbi:MAG: signal peptidase I [Peptococcaceae bacterium]|nr:signal peptidase I [Peptococcaceae bacterium]
MRFLMGLGSWILSLAAGIIAALFITLFVVQPTYVEGSSMEPTLQNKDKILINKVPSTLNRVPDYGDIVVIDSRVREPHSFEDDLSYNIKHNLISQLFVPSNDNRYWIKRVIGKAGDTLELRDGKILRNGKEIQESYIKEKAVYPKITVKVSENQVYVMGDNRNVSRDSREIGCVPLSHVLGKYQFKF